MKKQLIKVQAFTLSLLLLFVGAACPAAAEDTTRQLIKFDSYEKVSWFVAQNGTVEQDRTIHYDDAAMSAKWSFSVGSVAELRIQYLGQKGVLTDWTDYDTLKLRIYSDTASGNKIYIRPIYTEDSYGGEYWDAPAVTVDWTGWKELVIPFNACSSYGDMSGWDSIQSFGIFATDTSGGGALYFDEIWLEKTPLAEGLTFHSAAQAGWFVTRNGSVAADETVKYDDAAMSVRWDLTAGQVAELRLQYLEQRGMVTDWSEYAMLKMRIYSAAANGNHVLVRTMPTQDGYSEKQEDGSTIQKHYEQAFDVNWTGWKEIEISLSTFVSNNMTGWDSIQSIGLFETNMGGGALYLDEIWLEGPSAEIIKFDTPESLSAFAGVTLTADDHTFGGAAMSARWDLAAQNSLRLQKIADRGTVTDWSSYPALRLVAYSDMVSDTRVLVRATPTEDTYGNAYLERELAIDWTGWKELFLPLSSFTAYGGMESFESVQGFCLFALDSTDGEALLLQEIELVQPESDMHMLGANPAPGSVGIMREGACVTVGFSNEVGEVNPQAVTISRSNAASPATVTTEQNRMILSLPKLETGETIAVTLQPWGILDVFGQPMEGEAVTWMYTAAETGISAEKPVFYDEQGIQLTDLPEDGRLQVKTNVTGAAQGQEAILVTAQFSEEGEMIGQSTATGADGMLQLQLDGVESGRLLAVVCDSLESPQWMTFAVLPAASEVFYEGSEQQSGIAVSNVEITDSVLSILGSRSGPQQPILLTMYDGDGVLQLLDVVEVAQDGSFSYHYTMQNVPSGTYHLSLNSFGETLERSFTYLSESDKRRVVEEVNAALSAQEIVDLIQENAELLGAAQLSDTALRHGATTLWEQRPYETYQEIADMLAQAQDVLTACNEAVWSNLTAVLTDYADLILYDNDECSYYFDLDTKAQNIINREIVKSLPTESFTDFRTNFSAAVEKYRKGELTSSGNTGGASGGGGGGSGASSNRGSSASSSYQIVDVQPESWPDESKQFIDLEGYEWAVEYIQYLYQQDVVSMPEDGKFRPDDLVTREEFVKLLLLGMGADGELGTSSFSDLRLDAWYAPYVVAAEKLGLVSGNGEGQFGVGQPITRQDMAVLCSRAAKLFQRELPVLLEAQAFVDEADIADYAWEAVEAMQQANILSGVGDGRFLPQEYATRAQAAKVIAAMMQLTEQKGGEAS